MRLRSLLPVSLVLLAAACGDPPPDPGTRVPVPEADVERFRAEVFRETLDIDAALAALEAEAAASDSVAQAAYGPVLDALRAERRRLQVRLDRLRPTPPVTFDSATVDLRAQAERLAASVERARYDAAPTAAALRAATLRGLSALDARLAAFRVRAAADSTGRLLRAVDSLAADRARLDARLGAYPDTSEAQFPRFRQSITDGVLALDARADALAADTSRGR
ncbi:hypothetical protein [Rubrivirga sp. IMCC43871]|uniref:hypothetical protein n=1 Tax=Rubrivirga sp. IMCC43871 TaxID=3391575 RepID=UPI00399025C1